MFDPKKFKTIDLNAFQKVRQIRTVVDGVDPLAGLKARHVGTASVVARKNDERVIVVLVPMPFNSFAPDKKDRYLVTTYWGAKPQEVLESVRGTREFLDLSGDWTWCGGGREMDVARTYWLLVQLAKGEQDL